MAEPFWIRKRIDEMSSEEWEALCDGCGKCCLHKLEDEDSGEIYYTDIACHLLDDECRCRDYPNRKQRVAACLSLTPAALQEKSMLPATCAYRLLAEGKALFPWHPLISGDSSSVHAAGMSVKNRCTSEQWVHPDELEERIVHWVN